MGYFTCYGTLNVESSFSWRFPFALQGFLAIVFSISIILFLSESPRWLTAVGRDADAQTVWEKLGVSETEREKDNSRIDTTEVLAEHELGPTLSRSTVPRAGIKPKHASLLAVFAKDAWKQTVLGMFLMAMQQLSGIDGVLYASIPNVKSLVFGLES